MLEAHGGVGICPERLSCLMMVGTRIPSRPQPSALFAAPPVPEEADLKGLYAEHLISGSAAGTKASRFLSLNLSLEEAVNTHLSQLLFPESPQVGEGDVAAAPGWPELQVHRGGGGMAGRPFHFWNPSAAGETNRTHR